MSDFHEDSEICRHSLAILNAVVKELPEEIIALKFLKAGVPQTINKLICSNVVQPTEKIQALNLMMNLSDFHSTHKFLAESEFLKILSNKLTEFIEKSHSDSTNSDFSLLILYFKILVNFCGNSDIKNELVFHKIMEKMGAIFQKYNELHFLSELYIVSLKKIAKTYDGCLLLKNSDLNINEICAFSLNSCNNILIDATIVIVNQIMDDESIKRLVLSILAKNDIVNCLNVFSFLSSGNNSLEICKRSEIIDRALELFQNEKITISQKLAAVNSIKVVISLDESLARHLETLSGLDIILSKMINEENLFVWSQITELMITSMEKLSFEDLQDQLKKKYVINVIQRLEKMNSTFESFLRNAMTIEKAINSINYHQGDIAKFILQTINGVKEKDIVDSKLALNFLICKSFARSVFFMIKILKTKHNDTSYVFSEMMMSNVSLLMKLFKNSESLHLRIFEMFSVYPLNNTAVVYISNNQWPASLCDLVLKKPEWKKVSLFILRFFDLLIGNKQNIKLFQSNLSTIKLLATIKNYIIEEDYREFEDEEHDQIELGSAKKKQKMVLLYHEEREIYKKSSELIEKLIDAGSLMTFRGNVERGIANFKPKSEIIQILRADFAILACINSINFFGIEGLKNNLHNVLKGYIENLEKVSHYQHFNEKEKLITDAIRAIANFICITWSDKGSKEYEIAECSIVVFSLLEKYLKEAMGPFQAFVFLKAFKEWLINRLEIIEAYNIEQKNNVYMSDHFMLIVSSKVDATIVNVLDTLYQNHDKFYKSQKVVHINLEIITLLCHLSRKWKSKVANSFIAQLLEILNSDLYSTECEIKAIELLKLFTGTDNNSEETNPVAIKNVLASNGLSKIFKSIFQIGFDPEFITICKPLIEGLIFHDSESDATLTKKLIDEFIEKMDEFNTMNDDKKLEGNILKQTINVLGQMNNFCLLEILQDYLKEKRFANKVNQVWSFTNDQMTRNQDLALQIPLKTIDSLCATGVVNSISKNHPILSHNDQENEQTANEILTNCFKSLYRNVKNPEAVWICSKLINSCFPSKQAKDCIQINKALKGDAYIMQIDQMYKNDHNKEFARESHDLYLNLTDTKKDEFINNQIGNAIKEIDNALTYENIPQLTNSLKLLQPLMENATVKEENDKFGITKRVLEVLRCLKKTFDAKININCSEIRKNALSNISIPNLTTNERSALIPEISLSQNLMGLLGNCPENIIEDLRNVPDIASLIEIPLFLNGEINSIEAIDKLFESKKFLAKHQDAGFFEIATYILLRKNKDSFKPNNIAENEDVEKSVLFSLKNSNIANLGASVLLAKPKENNQNIFASNLMGDPRSNKSKIFEKSKVENFAENLALFTKVINKVMVPEKFMSIIQQYLSDLKGFQSKNPISVFNLIVSSRYLVSLLHIKDSSFDFAPYADEFMTGYLDYLRKLTKSSQPNKKLVRLNEDIFSRFAKRVKKQKKEFRNVKLWNKMLYFYFVFKPEFISGNSKRIFKNLSLSKPNLSNKNYVKLRFNKTNGLMEFVFDFSLINILSGKNQKNTDAIFKTMKLVIASSRITPPQFFNILEGISRCKFGCNEFMKSEVFESYIALLNNYQDYNDTKSFNEMATILINCLGAANDFGVFKSAQNQKIHSDNFSKKFFDVIDGFHQELFRKNVTALIHVFTKVPNKSSFYDERIPEKLLEIVGQVDDWKNDMENYFIIFAFMIGNDSLENMLSNLGHFTQICEYFDRNSIDKELKVAELESAGTECLFFSSDRDVRVQEIIAYSIDEYYKYAHNVTGDRAITKKDYLFKLFSGFRKFTHDYILCYKTIEAIKNGVQYFTDEDFETYKNELTQFKIELLEELKKHSHNKYIAAIIQKIFNILQSAKGSQGVPQVETKLEEIEDEKPNFIRRMSKDNVEKLGKKNLQKSEFAAFNLTITDISEILKNICESLESGPLLDFANNLLSICLEKINSHFSGISDTPVFNMFSLDIPVYLRTIANSPNADMFYRNESLFLLLKFLQIDDLLLKMLLSDFYVQKSVENINSTLNEFDTLDKLQKKEKQLMDQDTEFLKIMTSLPEGVAFVNENESEAPILIAHLLNVIQSFIKVMPLRVNALEIINHIILHSDNKRIENEILANQVPLVEDNYDDFAFVNPLLVTFSLIAKKSKDNKIKFVKNGVLLKLKSVTDAHYKNEFVNVGVSTLVLDLVNECPENHEPILTSNVLTYLAAAFNNAIGQKKLYENVSKIVLQIGYQNNEKKMKLINIGFAAGLITLFDIFSTGKTKEPEICSNILKCMANFSVMPVGAEHLLKDKVILSFNRYFHEYKETMPEQVRLAMVTMSNMAYMPKKQNLEMIIADGGVQLMLDCLLFAEGKGDEELTEACIDGITQISSDDKALVFLEMTNALDTILDMVRRQTNDKLIYKGLMSMNQFCRKASFSDKILEKGGHSIAAEIIKKFPKDHKNFMQSLKLLKTLIHNNKDKLNRFSQGGIPEKIIMSFSEDLPSNN